MKVNNWNHDLSLWTAPAVFGKEDFGNGISETLKEVENLCTDKTENIILEDIRWQGCSLCGRPVRRISL